MEGSYLCPTVLNTCWVQIGLRGASGVEAKTEWGRAPEALESKCLHREWDNNLGVLWGEGEDWMYPRIFSQIDGNH